MIVMLLAVPVQAEMDPSDYEVPPAELTEEEAAALRDRISAEIAAERTRAEAEAQTQQEAVRAESARLAARPLGEQLVDARCASCHGRGTYQGANLGWLGWQATVWRMKIVNGAGLARGEYSVIANWLHAQYPPTGGRAAREWLALLLIIVALPLPWALSRRRKRR